MKTQFMTVARIFQLYSEPADLKQDMQQCGKGGDPKGNRTPVFGVRGRRPGPLDDGTLLNIKKAEYRKKNALSNTFFKFV